MYNLDKVSRAEIKRIGIDAVIEKHFYVKRNLTFENLLGIHFFNKTLDLDESEKIEKALKYAILSYQYDPCDETYYLLGSILSRLISKTEASNIAMVKYLVEYLDIEKNSTRRTKIIEQFNYVVANAFHRRDDTAFISEAESIIENHQLKSRGQSHFNKLY